MRKTNILTRLGTYGLVLGGLGATTPIVSTVIAAEETALDTSIATLQMMPATMDADIEAEINRLRAGVVDGSLPATAITKWKGINSNIIRMELTENGPRDVVVYDVHGEDLTGSEKDAVLASVAPLFELCTSYAKAGSSTPDYYNMPSGSTGLSYNVTCMPKAGNAASDPNSEANIKAVLADEDLSLDTRQFRALGMKIRQLAAEFKAETPNPTRSQYLDRCLYDRGVLKSGYKPDNAPHFTAADDAAFCETLTAKRFGARAE